MFRGGGSTSLGNISKNDISFFGYLSNFFIKFHLQLTQSDCLEAFQDPSIGGIALALPHGSVVIECAKVPDPF